MNELETKKEESEKKQKLSPIDIFGFICAAAILGLVTFVTGFVLWVKGVPSEESDQAHVILVSLAPIFYVGFFLTFLYIYFLNPYDRRRK
ncbi:MAG TPA: hypothetical protein VI937_00500 [Negativicutes bacterium]|nr:hypothetical protein [Negativicutes bacterium]